MNSGDGTKTFEVNPASAYIYPTQPDYHNKTTKEPPISEHTSLTCAYLWRMLSLEPRKPTTTTMGFWA